MLYFSSVSVFPLEPSEKESFVTCLDYAAVVWDILRDIRLIAALKEDGPIVIDIQHSDMHSGCSSPPFACGAIICRNKGKKIVHVKS